jgi:pimeloyl-ACP methyl ester carboxylesterase
VKPRVVRYGGAALAVEEIGEGEPIVFLHAAIADRRMWQSRIECVAATHRAILYDRRGVGQTRARPRNYSAIDDLFAVLDALAGGRPAILVGNSQGGRIALDAALRHPERVSKLVLIAGSVTGAPDPVYPKRLLPLVEAVRKAESLHDWDRLNTLRARLFLDGALGAEGRVGEPARQFFLAMHDAIIRMKPSGRDVDQPPAYKRLKELAMPTLVLWGDLDLPHIQKRCRHVAAKAPRGIGRVLPGTAHLPNLERPGDVMNAIADFVAG